MTTSVAQPEDVFAKTISKPWTTGSWLNYVKAKQGVDINKRLTYNDYSVISCTHVKDLNSEWVHEYVVFVIDTKNYTRSKLFAERDADDKDKVYVGRHDNLPASMDRQPVPLPIQTLQFADAERPSIMDISSILNNLTLKGGSYSLFIHNCFWFAAATVKKLQKQFPKAKKINWQTVKPGEYLIPRLFGGSYAMKAGSDMSTVMAAVVIQTHRRAVILSMKDPENRAKVEEGLKACAIKANGKAVTETIVESGNAEDHHPDMDENTNIIPPLAWATNAKGEPIQALENEIKRIVDSI